MQKIVWKYGNFMGGLLCNGSPPFTIFSEKYKWNIRSVRGTIGSEIYGRLKDEESRIDSCELRCKNT